MRFRETQNAFIRIQSTPNCRENLYSAAASRQFGFIVKMVHALASFGLVISLKLRIYLPFSSN